MKKMNTQTFECIISERETGKRAFLNHMIEEERNKFFTGTDKTELDFMIYFLNKYEHKLESLR